MTIRQIVSAIFISAGLASLLLTQTTGAQAPGTGTVPAAAGRVHGNLAQVMRGILFPNSNVIFFAQTQDPAAVKPEDDPSMATNPLGGVYGGWQAVENSGVALAEAANLLTLSGRVCSNGRPVPVDNADWKTDVQELRDAGMAAYKAGQSKNQDAVLEASDRVATACANCHDVYREKTPAQGGPASRCMK
jgi:hypothetical protein